MSNRVRITERMRQRRAVDDSQPYPGNVNQSDREFKEWQEYHTFEHTTNHELPDLRHEWKNEQTPAGRDDIGFGIPETSNVPTVPAAPAVPNPPKYDMKTAQVAKVKAAASKSVKLAVLLLGDKVTEDVIEMQARDFMRLGSEALDRALRRFSESEELYVPVAGDDKDEDDSDEEKEASRAVATDDKDEDDKDSDDEKEASKKMDDDDSDEEKEASKKMDDEDDSDEEKEASETVAGDDKDEDDSDEEKEASEVEAGKKMDDDDEEDDSDKEASEAPKSSGVAELDIELTAGSDETIDPSGSDDLLASLYDDQVAPVKQASTKKGAKSIGTQPKVTTASKKVEAGSGSLEALWGETPDVSGVFV